jgi:hypothetical protein
MTDAREAYVCTTEASTATGMGHVGVLFSCARQGRGVSARVEILYNGPCAVCTLRQCRAVSI